MALVVQLGMLQMLGKGTEKQVTEMTQDSAAWHMDKAVKTYQNLAMRIPWNKDPQLYAELLCLLQSDTWLTP